MHISERKSKSLDCLKEVNDIKYDIPVCQVENRKSKKKVTDSIDLPFPFFKVLKTAQEKNLKLYVDFFGDYKSRLCI